MEKTRGANDVATFIDGLWNYEIDERDGKFVVVCVTKESVFDPKALRRVSRTERDDASGPLDTRADAEAFIAKRKGR